MKKRISNEELSAFLDGEAKRPEEVQRQIQQSEETARRYTALSKASAQVQSLPELHARPGLAGRVAASLSEPQSRERFVWPVRVGALLVATTVLAAFIIVAALDDSASPPILQTAEVTPATVPPAEVSAIGNEDVLVAELERRLASSATSASLLSAEFDTAPEPINELPEELLLALAPSDWLETFAGSNATQDYRTELGALSDGERTLFVQLLEEYARTEMQGQPPAREG